jgi:pantetheine-phosphate adenylyltransferase
MAFSSTVAIYPGSFDPITLGHIDIIRRIQPILGGITLLISSNSAKKSLFTPQERKLLAEDALKGLEGVTVAVHEGLTVDYLKKVKARVIIRGLRAVSDYEYELVMANMNKKLSPKVETMIVFASPEFYYVSSNTVKEVAMNGGSVKDLVPPNVARALKIKFADHLEKLRERQSRSKATSSSPKSRRN